ncbi:MAG TPA: MBL fold metallo-hydrolase [Thermoanaerobaculia bacterium]|jgi:ribonuclease BN (tRNA processing enzyme)
MRLRVLGSSGGYPAPGNPSTGFLLEHGEARLWIDAGNGTFAELQRLADFTRLDAILLSHVHADHCADVYPVHVALRYGVGGGLRLPLYAPPGTREILGSLLGPTGAEQLAEAFDFHEVNAGDAIGIAGVRFTFLRTDHPAHTLAMRAETAAGTLTYSADTGPGADLAGFARGSDLLLCEANYQDARMGPPLHLSARQAGDTARRAGARELALTHVWPTLDPAVSLAEARQEAGGVPVRWAGPGEIFEVGSGG